MNVRVRFAPSPTGKLHLGNARVAAFNWLFARSHDGTFVLRIEDTDREREARGSEADIVRDLAWLGLDWDEGPDVGGPCGPYRQSLRAASHLRAVETLVASGSAYPCFCEKGVAGEHNRDRRYPGTCRGLDADERNQRLLGGAPHAVRFASPRAGVVRVADAVAGNIEFPATDVDDFVLRRRDGGFTYNFAAAVDDADMRITHVIRGSGHLSNTPKQVLILRALGAPEPIFAHLPTVLGPDGSRLAKRRGATPVRELRDAGYPPDAVLNYLSLLGWSHPGDREILTRAELIGSVGLDRVDSAAVRHDPAKLRWLSAKHVATDGLSELAAKVEVFIERGRKHPVGVEWLATVDALRSRLATYGDINKSLEILYPTDEAAASRARQLATVDRADREVVVAVRSAVDVEATWDRAGNDVGVRAQVLGETVRSVGQTLGMKGAKLFHPLRRALIGMERGPEIGRILSALGRAETLRRLDEALG